MNVLVYICILFGCVQYGTGQCPTPEWKFRGGSCYLFKMNIYEDESDWNEALGLCKSVNSSLVTIHNKEEQQYVHSTMIQETNAPTLANAWTGMYKEDFGLPYIWENGEAVVYTNWAPGEPNDQDGTQNCVRMYSRDGEWDDYFCQNSIDDNNIRHCYICKSKPDSQTSILPQHEISLSGNFTSTTGEFTNLCTLAYAQSMNSRANTMADTVNGLIGTDVCTGLTTDQMRLQIVSAPLITAGNMGSTSQFYMTDVGASISFTQVDNCASDISNYLSVHTNWDPTGEVLPPEEGCPGVQFTEESFTSTGSQWLCLDIATQSETPAELADNALHFRIAHNGVFESLDGSNISSSCLVSYNTRFAVDTYATSQSVGQMLGDSLCSGQDVSLGGSTASLVLAGTQQGASIQTYELQPGLDNTFNDVHSCSFEVSAYLSDHNNWGSLLPPIEGCPQLSFTTSFFSLGETQWLCV